MIKTISITKNENDIERKFKEIDEKWYDFKNQIEILNCLYLNLF